VQHTIKSYLIYSIVFTILSTETDYLVCKSRKLATYNTLYHSLTNHSPTTPISLYSSASTKPSSTPLKSMESNPFHPLTMMEDMDDDTDDVDLQGW